MNLFSMINFFARELLECVYLYGGSNFNVNPTRYSISYFRPKETIAHPIAQR